MSGSMIITGARNIVVTDKGLSFDDAAGNPVAP